DLACSGGGFVEEPPQGLVPEGMVGVEEGSQFGFGDGSGPGVGVAVDPVAAPFEPLGGRGGGPALAGGLGEERPEGGDGAVP
ncbi:MAG: hypothetical protein ACRDYC_01350, partial [Acidimicrobiales bacterium]